MINMIKADFYRVFHGIGIYIGIALMLLFIGTSVYVIEPGSIGVVMGASEDDITTDEVVYLELDTLEYENVQNLSISEYRRLMKKTEGYRFDKAMLAHNMNLYYVFIFVAALAVAVDFSGGSVKNTLSSAISRNKYFLSKTMFTVIVCLLIFFANTYISYFANIIFNGKNLASDIGTVTRISLMQLPPILALVSVLNGIGFMAKKTSIFNTIAIPLIMVFQLLFDTVVTLLGVSGNFVQYELQSMIYKLSYNPSEGYIAKSFAVCGVIIVVSNLIGYLSFRKAEIK